MLDCLQLFSSCLQLIVEKLQIPSSSFNQSMLLVPSQFLGGITAMKKRNTAKWQTQTH